MNSLRPIAISLGCGLAAGLVYLSALPGAFHFDDFHSIMENPVLVWASFRQIFTDPSLFSGLAIRMYRPLTVLSFALHFRLGAAEPVYMISVNILIHAFTTALFFGVARLLFAHDGRAAVAALIFALHPLQSQAVNYISCRSSLLAACFSVAALLFLLTAVSGRKRWQARGLMLGSLLCFGLALLAKEEAFAAAFLPLLFLFLAPASRRRKELALMSGGFLVLAGTYLFWRHYLGLDVMIPSEPLRSVPANFATGVRAMVHYLGLALWPVGLSVVHDLKPSFSLFDPAAILAALFLLSLPALCLLGRRPLSALGLLWFLLALAPTHTLVPLRNLLAEHHVYFSMAGLAIAFTEGLFLLLNLEHFSSRPVFRKVLTAGFLLLLLSLWSGKAIQRSRQWQSEDRLWSTAVQRAPENPTAWGNAGVAWWEKGRTAASRRAFERTLTLAPDHRQASFNLGRIYIEAGEVEAGISLLRRVEEKEPQHPEVFYQLALGCLKGGQFEEAAAYLERTLALAPRHLTACETLAALYIRELYSPEKAQAVLGRCMAIKPTEEELIRIRSLVFELEARRRQKEKLLPP